MSTKTHQNKTQKEIVFLSQICPGSYQHREAFARNEMENLTKTIKEHGVLNPLIVYRDRDEYPLIAGERRWRALCAIQLYEQGLMTWPQAIDMISAEDARQQLLDQRRYLTGIEIEVKVAPKGSNHRILSVIENGQRQNLTPLEEARDYQGLLDDGYTSAEAAELAGKSETTVTATVSLLDLEPEVQAMLEAGDLDKTQGIHLATVKDRDAQIGLAQRAQKAGWNVATTKTACQAYNKQLSSKNGASSGRKKTPQTTTKAAVPLANVTPVHIYQVPGGKQHLSPESIEYILALSEECCSSCRVHGISTQCLSCDGFIEFATRLIQEVNYES
jgi:ParB family chromosome partitioning protein